MSEQREVQQVLARYVRAADQRDGAAMSSLFIDEARVEIYEGQQTPGKIGLIEGSGAIGAAVAGLMKPHPASGWSHQTTHDPIIDVEGDVATIAPGSRGRAMENRPSSYLSRFTDGLPRQHLRVPAIRTPSTQQHQLHP